MRNKTAFIFVLSANLVLLAHAVVPHHHHNENPISVSVECSQHEEHNHHVNVPICHEEHEDHETTTCSLAQAILIPNNQLRVVEKTTELESSEILFIALFNYNFSSQDKILTDSYRIAENIPLSTWFLISSQRLRAPPVC